MICIEFKNKLLDYISNLSDINDELLFDIDKITENNYSIGKIKLTCIILTFNEERCIKRCIDSVVDTFDEIIIVDIGSNDKTKNIVCHINNSKIKLYDYKWDNNFSNARNFGIYVSTGDWVTFIDADEEFLEGSLFFYRDIISVFNDMKGKENVVFSFKIKEKNLNNIYDDIPRVVYKNGNCKYFGRVHEEVRCNNNIPLLLKLKIELVHDGYNSMVMKNKRKISRNLNLLKKMLIEEPEYQRWQYFYIRDGLNILPENELVEFINKSIKINFEKSISIENLKVDTYTFKILDIYFEILLKKGFFLEIIQLTDGLINRGINNYNTIYYNTLSKILNEKNNLAILLEEVKRYRNNNFEIQDNQISREGYHIDLLIALLLYENMQFNKSQKYFRFLNDRMAGIIDQSITDYYLQLLNKIMDGR